MHVQTLFSCWPSRTQPQSVSKLSYMSVNAQLIGQNEARPCRVAKTEVISSSLYRELALGPLDRPSRVLFGGIPLEGHVTWEDAGIEESATVMVEATLWLDEVEDDMDMITATLQGEAAEEHTPTNCGFWGRRNTRSNVAGLAQALQAVQQNARHLPRNMGDISERGALLLGATVQAIRHGQHDDRVQRWGTKALSAIIERGAAYKRCLALQGADSAVAELQQVTTDPSLVAELCCVQKRLAEEDFDQLLTSDSVTDRAWLELLTQHTADHTPPLRHALSWSSDSDSGDEDEALEDITRDPLLGQLATLFEEPNGNTLENDDARRTEHAREGVTDVAWRQFLLTSDLTSDPHESEEPALHRTASWRTDSSAGSLGG